MMCMACKGRGWLLADNSDHGLRIERCDACGLYSDDEAAVAVVAAKAIAWDAEGRRENERDKH